MLKALSQDWEISIAANLAHLVNLNLFFFPSRSSNSTNIDSNMAICTYFCWASSLDGLWWSLNYERSWTVTHTLTLFSKIHFLPDCIRGTPSILSNKPSLSKSFRVARRQAALGSDAWSSSAFTGNCKRDDDALSKDTIQSQRLNITAPTNPFHFKKPVETEWLIACWRIQLVSSLFGKSELTFPYRLRLIQGRIRLQDQL